jgi:hypothetical protein
MTPGGPAVLGGLLSPPGVEVWKYPENIGNRRLKTRGVESWSPGLRSAFTHSRKPIREAGSNGRHHS